MTYETYYEKGEVYYHNEDFRRALRLFQKHFETYGDNDSLNYIGCCYLQLNEFDHAMKIFKKLMNAEPEWARPVCNLGRVYLKLGKYSEAFKYFNKALDVDPYEEEIYFYIGTYYYKINNFQKSIDYYKRLLDINDLQPEAHMNLGICYSKLGMHMQAIEELDIAYSQDSEFTDALFNKAMVYLAMKEYAKAMDALMTLYVLQPDNIENMIDIVNCYLKVDDLNSADKWIAEILAKDPKNKTAHTLLKVLEIKGKIDSND